jgi:hypothetical protein
MAKWEQWPNGKFKQETSVAHCSRVFCTTISSHTISNKVVDSVYNRCFFQSNPNVHSGHLPPAQEFEDGVRAIARNWNTIGSGGSLKGTVGLEEGAGAG